MSFLSNLNPVSIASNTVESLCDAILPKQLEFVGDLAAGALDLTGGNWTKGIDDLSDLAKDLPQQASQLTAPLVAGAKTTQTSLARAIEPDSPPPYRSSPGAEKPSETASPPSTNEKLSNTTKPTGSTPSNTIVLAHVTPAVASPTSRPADVPSGASHSAVTTDSPQLNKAGEAKKSTETQGSDDFFALSDKELMDAIRNGKLPSSISDDPAQMQRLQLRMNEISEMNQLITTMLNTLHDMNKQVIQNLRV